MMRKLIVLVMILVGLMSVTALAETTTAPQKEHNFLSVADIHFDPFIECEKAPRPCPLIQSLRNAPYQNWDEIFEKAGNQSISSRYEDTNYPLLKISLEQMHYVYDHQHPDFVLVLGDFLGHKFDSKFVHYTKDHSKADYRAFVKKTMAYLAYHLRKTFPGVDIYPAVGNNDSYTGDYSVIPSGAFLNDTAEIWSELILNKKNRESFRQTFKKDGYYLVTVPGQPQHKIIVLDTVLFSDSTKAKPQKIAANDQLTWLHAQLLALQQQHDQVMLAFHIPVNFYVLSGMKTDLVSKTFWESNYIHPFESYLSEFATNITSILPAHIHIEVKQRIILKEFADVPVDFTPSISPIFGNDPGFKIFNYDSESFKIQIIHTYYYPLNANSPEWHKEYGMIKHWPQYDNSAISADT